MSQKTWVFCLSLLLVGTVLLFIANSAAADASPNPAAQVVYQTPTALPDGRVIYVVQDGDSCLRIEILTGVKVEQLRSLNKLDQNCTIAPGKELLLKVITPEATFTPNPLISPTPLLPTATPMKGNGQICVLLFEDVNGDAVHQDTESSIAGGAVSITNRLGTVSKTVNTTSDSDPLCTDVPEGEYNISMAIPPGNNPTKETNSTISVQAGQQAILEFGAQPSSKIETSPTQQPQNDNSLPLALLGGILILGGIGLGVYVLFTRASH